MLIHFPCSSCGVRLQAAKEKAGRTARCPSCKTVIDVPFKTESVSESIAISRDPGPLNQRDSFPPLGRQEQEKLKREEEKIKSEKERIERLQETPKHEKPAGESWTAVAKRVKNKQAEERYLDIYAKLTDREMPPEGFVIGIMNESGTESIAVFSDRGGRLFVPMWSCKSQIDVVSSSISMPVECWKKSKTDVIMLLLSHPECKCLILDPDAENLAKNEVSFAGDIASKILVFALSDYSLFNENAEKVLPLQGGGTHPNSNGRRAIPPRHIAIEETLTTTLISALPDARLEGIAIDFFSLMSARHEEKNPLELLTYTAKVMGNAQAKMLSEDENLSLSDDESVWFEWILEIEKAKLAAESCPPPPECNKCGESTWEHLSNSPSGKSVTWECSYCKKKIVVKANNAIAIKSSAGRKPLSKEVQREVWRRDEGRCVECGSQENLEYDHIIPFSKGGADTVRNLQLLCEKCNRSKGNRI